MSIEKFVDEFMRSRNATPLEDFEGFSAIEMYQILHHPFGNQCPIILNSEIDSGILETSPILKILRHLFSESYNSGGIQLTATGNLNRKLIIEIYEKRYLPDEHIDNGIVKLRSEKDWICLHGVHIVLKLAGFMRKRNNKLTLSQKRKVQFEKGKMSEIFFEFLQAYTTRFNWGYNDLYENDQIGQMGFLYLMYLFQKYGNDFRDLRYYCNLYYRAFPLLYMDDNLSGGFKYGKSENIVNIRFVERFAKWFGFVESRERKNDQFRYQKEVKLRVTELLSNLLIIRRQQGIQKEHT